MNDDITQVYEKELCEGKANPNPPPLNPSMQEFYRMFNENTTALLKVQATFTQQLHTLELRIVKYNGLWEHQDKQDRKFEEYQIKMDAKIEKLYESVKTIAEFQASCVSVRKGQWGVVQFIKDYGGWLLATLIMLQKYLE